MRRCEKFAMLGPLFCGGLRHGLVLVKYYIMILGIFTSAVVATVAAMQPIDLQSRIDAAAEAGGGIVRIGRGEWEAKPFALKSGVTLELSEGAVVYASTNHADLPGGRRRSCRATSMSCAVAGVRPPMLREMFLRWSGHIQNARCSIRVFPTTWSTGSCPSLHGVSTSAMPTT